MAFRTIIVSDRCKLDYSMNYLICRRIDEEKRVLIDEIKLLVIDSTQVSITTSLIVELSKKKVKIIFTDSKHNPECELVSYQNNFYSYRKIKEQLQFTNESKNFLWKEITKRKISNQASNLLYKDKIDEYNMLINYANDVQLGDATNREGHAAKVYFNALFGFEFNRAQDCLINVYLNYGYSILLSLISREIKMFGYLTELGIHHIGESNQFNLSCDLIEPLRPIVDKLVISNLLDENNYKYKLLEMLSMTVKYNDKEILLDNAIHLYVEDLLSFLKTGELDNIKFIEYEI